MSNTIDSNLLLTQLDKWIEESEKNLNILLNNNAVIQSQVMQAYAQAYWNVKQFIEVNNSQKSRLRTILSTMKTKQYETNEELDKNLEWFYRNLHVNNRRHKDYIEAIDIIEELLYNNSKNL